jgi:hypothetical protein
VSTEHNFAMQCLSFTLSWADLHASILCSMIWPGFLSGLGAPGDSSVWAYSSYSINILYIHLWLQGITHHSLLGHSFGIKFEKPITKFFAKYISGFFAKIIKFRWSWKNMVIWNMLKFSKCNLKFKVQSSFLLNSIEYYACFYYRLLINIMMSTAVLS